MIKLLIFITCLGLVTCGDIHSDTDIIDPVLYYLLNGEYENGDLETLDKDDESPGDFIWKCGKCDNLTTTRIIYKETNIDTDETVDNSENMQIGLEADGMRCIIVRGNVAGVVKQVTGDCEGPSATLTLAAANKFVIEVFGD